MKIASAGVIASLASASAVAIGLAAAGAAGAVTLPKAISYEYFGFNFAENERSSTAIGTLDYTGQPGCAGVCTATTALGGDPSVSLSAPEVVYEYTAGGHAEADLQYYFEYENAPGTYTVTLHTSDSLDVSPNAAGQNLLIVGQSNGDYDDFYQYSSISAEESHCYNKCTINYNVTAPSQPFSSTSLQIQANTIYAVTLQTLIDPSADGAAETSSIDPTFTTTASGGDFAFSPGVTAGGVPEPAVWTLMLVGIAGVGATVRVSRRKQLNLAAAA